MKENIHEARHAHGSSHGSWQGFWHAEGHHGHHGHQERGRRGGPGRGQEWQDFFGGERGWGGPFSGPGGWGGHRERLERGLLRHVILSVLQDGPAHGYEIIKHLEERTQGHYSPSPGTLYPTLQYLEDLKLVRSEEDDGRRVYQLTDSGREELDKQRGLVEGFWSRFRDRTPSGANLHELKFAGDALKDLLRTVGGGLRNGAFASDPDTVRKVRQALERCQTEIREIMAQGIANRPSSNRDEPDIAKPPASDSKGFL